MRRLNLGALLVAASASCLCAGPVQTLIDAANPGDTVSIPAGVFIDVLTIDKDLTLRGAGLGKTIIDSDLELNVVLVTGGHVVTLQGITFQSSRPRIAPQHLPRVSQGLIHATVPVSMIECEVDGSHPGSDYLGGIFSSGHLTLVGCWIHHNDMLAVICESLSMTNCLVDQNLTYSATIQCNGAAALGDSIVSENTTLTYGAVYLGQSATPSRIERTKFVANISESEGSSPSALINLGTLEMSGCLFTEQWSTSHAAFANHGTATVSDTTFSGNTVSERYDPRTAGIENYGTMILRSVTVVSNTVEAISPDRGYGGGGGIRNYGTLTMANCLVSGNRAYATGTPFIFPGQDILGSVISDGHNLILNTNDCVITGDTTGNVYGKDPLLGPLQDNGGPTPTHALLPGSPAIAAGSPSMIGTSDQRGLPRYQGPGSRPDIGAYQTLSRPTPVIFPLASDDPALFLALLVGEPTTPYKLQQAGEITNPTWTEVTDLTTDRGGFARFATPRTSSETKTFLRVTKP